MEKSRDRHEVSGESTEGQPSLKPGLNSHPWSPITPNSPRARACAHEMGSDSEAIWPNRWPLWNCREEPI